MTRRHGSNRRSSERPSLDWTIWDELRICLPFLLAALGGMVAAAVITIGMYTWVYYRQQ
jgi:hypothetical protein